MANPMEALMTLKGKMDAKKKGVPAMEKEVGKDVGPESKESAKTKKAEKKGFPFPFKKKAGK